MGKEFSREKHTNLPVIDPPQTMEVKVEDMRETAPPEVTFSTNKVVIRNRTIPSLIQEILGVDGSPSYRDVADLGLHIHDALQQNGGTCCKGRSSGSRNACLVVTRSVLEHATRGSFVVVPTESLFPSEKAKAVLRGKGKKNRTLTQRSLCILWVHEDPGTGNVEFVHSPLQYITASLVSSRYFLRPYDDEVANEEIWGAASPLTFRGVINDGGVINDWVGVDACSLWTMLEQALPTHRFDMGDSGSKTGVERLVKDMSQTMAPAALLSLRDSLVLNALRLGDIPKMRGIPEPAEATVVGSTDNSPYSISFFDNANQALSVARTRGMYMGAHDISPESGAKAYFVTCSPFEAFRNIRLGDAEAPPAEMYERGHNRRMGHSHECLRPESRTKLYLDIDIDVGQNGYLKSREGGRVVPWVTVNNITFATMFWFTSFFHKVFGIRPDNYAKDWTVLCATRPDRKISRHLILNKSECFFRTKVDLMMFMEMARQSLLSDIRGRNKEDDFHTLRADGTLNDDPTSWMVKVSTSIDPMTKSTIRGESCIVDFAVYNEFSCMRGLFCSKMNDPTRTLDWVEMTPNGSSSEEDLPVDFRIHRPPVPTDPEGSNRDFERWKRASVVCVDPPDGRGLTLPLGTMLSMPAGARSKAFTPQCWEATSSVTDLPFVRGLIQSKRKDRGGGVLGSWVFSEEDVAREAGEDCPYHMIRDYFAQENDPRIAKSVDVKAWAECDKYVMTLHNDMRTDEEIQGNGSKRRKCYTSNTYDYGDMAPTGRH
jgi:hypothetical protein